MAFQQLEKADMIVINRMFQHDASVFEKLSKFEISFMLNFFPF